MSNPTEILNILDKDIYLKINEALVLDKNIVI